MKEFKKKTFTVGELAQALGMSGEMGNTNGNATASQTAEAYLKEFLGVQGEMNTIKAQIQAGAEALKEKETMAKKEKISEAIKAKVSGEMNQTLIAEGTTITAPRLNLGISQHRSCQANYS